jgi:hypothetical protein
VTGVVVVELFESPLLHPKNNKQHAAIPRCSFLVRHFALQTKTVQMNAKQIMAGIIHRCLTRMPKLEEDAVTVTVCAPGLPETAHLAPNEPGTLQLTFTAPEKPFSATTFTCADPELPREIVSLGGDIAI